MLMAKLFQELKRHNKFNFELVFLVMDPGYSRENREIIEHNAKLLGVPVTIFESEIFDAVYTIEKSPCVHLRQDAARIPLFQGEGVGLQQNRARPPL